MNATEKITHQIIDTILIEAAQRIAARLPHQLDTAHPAPGSLRGTIHATHPDHPAAIITVGIDPRGIYTRVTANPDSGHRVECRPGLTHTPESIAKTILANVHAVLARHQEANSTPLFTPMRNNPQPGPRRERVTA